MLYLTDLKPGVCLEYNGEPYQVVASEHSKMGRGGAIMRTKLKNLISGVVFDRTFKGNEQFEEADITKKIGQYLYRSGETFAFMDSGDFTQYELAGSVLGNTANFLKEGSQVDLIIYNDQLIGVDLPAKVDLAVTYSEQGIRGDTQGTTTKSVTLETGLNIQVPLFVKQGDIVRVDTRDGKYEERVNS